MSFFSAFILVVFVIAALLVILLVTAQDDQGEGLGGLFSGSTSIGSRKGNPLQRLTSALSVILFVSAFGFALLNKDSDPSSIFDKEAPKVIEEGQEWWRNGSTGAEPQKNNAEQESAQEAPSEAGAQ